MFKSRWVRHLAVLVKARLDGETSPFWQLKVDASLSTDSIRTDLSRCY